MVVDHGTLVTMDQITISQFKATCLAVLKRVRRTRRPVLVTKFGEPVAQVLPPPPAPRPTSWLGNMAGTGRILDDIIAPASHERDWEVLGR